MKSFWAQTAITYWGYSNSLVAFSLHFKHTAAHLRCMGKKRTMRHQGLETSKCYSFGISLDISAVVFSFCGYAAHKHFTCKYKQPLNIKKYLLNGLFVSYVCVCVFSSIFTPAFVSESLAALETESRYTSVLILECCCSQLRTSCEQGWDFLHLAVICCYFQTWGVLILFLCW